MNIISFNWTTLAVQAEVKTCSRRDWDSRHARQFRAGELVQAYSAAPHRGGEKVKVIRLTDIYRERACDAPETDWEAEGFAFMEERGLLVGKVTPATIWADWKESTRLLYVVRFDYELSPLFTFYSLPALQD